jgi:hypothetical protein
LEELEAAVPEELLVSMWSGVQRGVEAQPAHASADAAADAPPKRLGVRRIPWLVPTLAAASIVLLFTTGFLFSELRRTEARGAQLAEQIGGLERGLADLDARTEWVERTAQLAGGGRNRARALDFVFSGQDHLTVEALLDLLGGLPKNLVLFNTSQVEALSGGTSHPPRELREVLAVLQDALTTLEGDGGVLVGEFAAWLSSSGLPRDMALPKSPLLDLLS